MANEPVGILLATVNAKWVHPSLALRLLKANLGNLEKDCRIVEFALRQPLPEKTEPIVAARPRILGLSVSIWNHSATLELLKELRRLWQHGGQHPLVVLGGPEVSCLPPEAAIFQYADYCIRGEGETAFRQLCERVFGGFAEKNEAGCVFVNQQNEQVNVDAIASGYRLYTDEDLQKKLIYVEASRGCPFSCEFCLSPVLSRSPACAESSVYANGQSPVREFNLERFLADMGDLIQRGAYAAQADSSAYADGKQNPLTFKFLDRSFNLNIERARRIMEFFLEKIAAAPRRIVVHFEMLPSRFPPELCETLARFPPGTLRLEIGIQTLNSEVSSRIGRPSRADAELETVRLLRRTTNAIIHADLIAALPGEDMASFGKGFDRLWAALQLPMAIPLPTEQGRGTPAEIQLGILKLLPAAPIARHREAFGLRWNPLPPYEATETAALPAADLDRIKNFARFWELIVNRSLADIGGSPVFERFMALSDSLLAHFGRNYGIDKNELRQAVEKFNSCFASLNQR